MSLTDSLLVLDLLFYIQNSKKNTHTHNHKKERSLKAFAGMASVEKVKIHDRLAHNKSLVLPQKQRDGKERTTEETLWGKCLPHKHEDLSLIPRKHTHTHSSEN